jgi:hypothetical protein
MKRVPVESDMLSWIAYDAERRLLERGFADGAISRYFDVPGYIQNRPAVRQIARPVLQRLNPPAAR